MFEETIYLSLPKAPKTTSTEATGVTSIAAHTKGNVFFDPEKKSKSITPLLFNATPSSNNLFTQIYLRRVDNDAGIHKEYVYTFWYGIQGCLLHGFYHAFTMFDEPHPLSNCIPCVWDKCQGARWIMMTMTLLPFSLAWHQCWPRWKLSISTTFCG